MSDTVKDSTPTAVTVSDRMRELVESFDVVVTRHARIEGADDPGQDADDEPSYDAERDAKNALLREIATLEAKADLNNDSSYLNNPADALIAGLPQMPVDPVIEWFIDDLRERVEFGSTSEELVRAMIDSYRIENARLLTALDEAKSDRDSWRRTAECLEREKIALQSSGA